MSMNPSIADWRGKRVWIIGASSGIGAQTAVLLLEKGALVALSARNLDALEKLAAGQSGAIVAPVDMTDHASLVLARERILEKWSGFDLILVVAGGYDEMRADTFDLAVANKMIDLNVRGVFNVLDMVLPVLLRQGKGALGIVASVAGYSGLPKALVYGPTKAALINLCEALYLDLRPRGLGVHLINPGFVDTAATAGNDFSMPGLMSAGEAARKLVSGLGKGHFHIHFPHKFTNWVRLARLLPYRLYFALVHKVTGL